MKLAPSVENVRMLREVVKRLEQVKEEAGAGTSDLLTRAAAELDGLARGDAESLEELLSEITGDVRTMTDTIQELVQEITALADALETEAHYSVLRAAGGSVTGAAGSNVEDRIAQAQARLQTAAGWLARKEINPKYKPRSYYSSNCGSCAIALWQRLTGVNAAARAGRRNIAPTIMDMERLTGLKAAFMEPDRIAAVLKQRGPGSHLIVGIFRNSCRGHWFNVYYDGKEIRTLDGQTGEIYDWPHDYGDIREWFVML